MPLEAIGVELAAKADIDALESDTALGRTDAST